MAKMDGMGDKDTFVPSSREMDDDKLILRGCHAL